MSSNNRFTALIAVAVLATCQYFSQIEEAMASSQPLFVDVAQTAGIDFVHFNGMSGEYFFPEMTGQGGALFDFDNDGDLDVYLIQGAMLGAKKTHSDALFPAKTLPVKDRLYRNDSFINDHKQTVLKFTDVTIKSKINIVDYGMGVATADYDNDGWVDLYVTGYGNNHLLHNNGDGTFTDTTQKMQVQDKNWSTSATFFDYDKDGWLDLYVVNYVDYDVNRNIHCYAKSSRLDYCGPSAFKPVSDRLFHNNKGQSFVDVTASKLTQYKAGPGLGVVAADFNGDGWLDLYVANDGASNQLWLNQSGSKFVDDALFAGAAVNFSGMAEASMGVTAADFDGDGDEDLFMTHLKGETNTLYQNDGTGLFEDKTLVMGLATASFPYTAFGTAWFDYDNDGWLDLITLNGAVQVIEKQAKAGNLFPLSQPNQLFKNINGQFFNLIKGEQVDTLNKLFISRGSSIGDLDNDGDMDLVIYNNNGPVQVLQNTANHFSDGKPINNNNWFGLRLKDKSGKRDLPGTKIKLTFSDGSYLWRRSATDGSYCSANDPRILIGYPDKKKIKSLEIYWLDGGVEQIKKEVINKTILGQYTTIQQKVNNIPARTQRK